MTNIYWKIKAHYLFGRQVYAFGKFTVKNAKNIKFGLECAINDGVFLLGEVGITIEDNVVLSANAMILDSGLDIRDFLTVEKPKHIHRKIIIKSGAWIGAGAIILPGVIVGEKSVVAAGSVVTRDVPPYCLVGGNPAKTIRVLSK